ncbi:FecCD family ABC transporter permease [Actinoplanes couchii]|uniref:Iron ABC transporter permease n=1 Tax=Actinoplanes couchii TaxID=403638 RepID=A0ABQ3XSG3_9ACTN|nr:iron chelate uptake ABC transporter family permease subunit [Actinoplanes couchii]MDR6320079.1 iron complex transport system permease protein [Actinoplanes couchii]GID61449.1 iron ABC transporter permease [Actinoplanes couchii]
MTRRAGLAACVLLLGVTIVLGLAIGARDLSWDVVLHALRTREGEAGEIVWAVRIPRTILALCVGAALGVAGALMQALTRNPLADPGLLGVNAGAAAAVVLGVVLGLPDGDVPRLILALIGAGLASALVMALGHSLILAGAAITATLTGLVAGITLLDQNAFDHYRFWVVGTLADQTLDLLRYAGPVLLAGLVIAVGVGRVLDVIALGDDSGAALGANPARTRLWGLTAVALLCGAATALVGPIGFLGLAVPHAARLICGARQRWILAYSAILGPLVLLAADVLGRIAARPGEIEVAIVMGLIGAPVFIALARTRKVADL